MSPILVNFTARGDNSDRVTHGSEYMFVIIAAVTGVLISTYTMYYTAANGSSCKSTGFDNWRWRNSLLLFSMNSSGHIASTRYCLKAAD
jgi:hypothetical protein